MRAIFSMLLVLAAGCGNDVHDGRGVEWDLEHPGAAAAAADECTSDAQCGDDAYCHRPSACGAPRFCEDGYPPISAAPPNAACSCNGVLTSVNHGYPGPHAWQAGHLADWGDDTTPCNAEASPPFDYTIDVHVPRPADALGARVLTRLSATLETDDREHELPADGWLRFRATGDQYAQFSVAVLVDVDDDGQCTPGVDQTYLATGEEVVDLSTFAVRVETTTLNGAGQDPCLWW